MGASVRVLPPPPAEVTESVELSSSALIPIGPPPLEEMTASLELVALGGDEVTASIQTPLDVAPLAEVTESVELMPLDVAPRLAEVTESVELLPLDVLRRAEEVMAQINPGPAPALPSFAALPPVPRLPFASAPRATRRSGRAPISSSIPSWWSPAIRRRTWS